MITHSYNDAVGQAEVLMDYPDADTAEKLVMLGYLAALKDSNKALTQSIQQATERGKAGRMYSIAHDKMVRLVSGASERAEELKV